MRKVVTVALLAVWLVFMSIEFLEHAGGLFLYPDQDVDRAVDAGAGTRAVVTLCVNESRHHHTQDRDACDLADGFCHNVSHYF